MSSIKKVVNILSSGHTRILSVRQVSATTAPRTNSNEFSKSVFRFPSAVRISITVYNLVLADLKPPHPYQFLAKMQIVATLLGVS